MVTLEILYKQRGFDDDLECRKVFEVHPNRSLALKRATSIEVNRFLRHNGDGTSEFQFRVWKMIEVK